MADSSMPAGQSTSLTPPPRPGDPIPDGGLDPTQVFASPPPPPPSQTTAQGDGSSPLPQDSGPPPPPPGVTATKEMGYDDEDLRVLGEVKDYRFGSITAKLTNEKIVIPGHPETEFDEQLFLTLLRGSISLTRDEKWRIIQAVPKLSQFQIDELQKILEDEKRKFSELSPKHLLQLMKLEQRHAEDWRDLQSFMVQKSAKKEEQSQVDEIRKQLGL
ncbi:hypothetical protein HYR82_04175 [Candidatus Peregrinibacteria bacterium]|nr:hypothetical protein [Candidatus Peregrinibacteria bacterium]